MLNNSPFGYDDFLNVDQDDVEDMKKAIAHYQRDLESGKNDEQGVQWLKRYIRVLEVRIGMLEGTLSDWELQLWKS